MSNLALFKVEEELTALLDTEQMVEDDQTKLEILNEIADTSDKAVKLRDNTIRLIRAGEAHAEMAKNEKDHWARMQKRYTEQTKRIKDWVVDIIERHGTKPKKGARYLEGTIGKMSLHANPPSLDVKDLENLPADLYDVEIKISGEHYAALRDEWSDEEKAQMEVTIKPRTQDIKRLLTKYEKDVSKPGSTVLERNAIQHPVPGADLVMGANSLRIR